MAKTEFSIGEKLPPPRVTIRNGTDSDADLIGPTITVITCNLVQPDKTTVRMCIAMPTGRDPHQMPPRILKSEEKIDFAPSGIWHYSDGIGYEPYSFSQEGTYEFFCQYEKLTSNVIELNVKSESGQSSSTASDNPAEPGATTLIAEGIPGENIPCYWLYLPENYDISRTLPVMIFLHGGGAGKDPDLEKMKDNGPLGYLLSDSELDSEVKGLLKQFIIINPVLPENPDNFTLWVDNIDALDAIVDSVITFYKGDPSRLYVTGNSRGGQGAWRFPKYSRHPVAAIVPVCGHYMDAANLEPLVEMPVWTLCNSGDRVHAVQMRAVSIIEEYDGDPFLLIDNATPGDSSFLERKHIATSFVKDGHDAWTATYRSPHIYKWMLSFKKSIEKL